MQSSEQIHELATALSAAQSEMAHAAKDRSNPAFKSKYADLASIMDACREPLTKYGIAVIQAPSVEGLAVSVETRFVHKSGQWIATTITAQLGDAKAQTIGSAVTYLRRYGLAAMAGVAPDDDDGNAGSRTSLPAQTAPSGPPTITVADALARVIKKHPDFESSARAIADSGATEREKLDRLRALFQSNVEVQ